MKLSRQGALVRDHLFKERHLTSWQAEGVYRIRRLASRISELKHAGYEIEKSTQKDATGQTYTRYSFSRRQRRSRTPRNAPTAPSVRLTVAQFLSVYRKYANDELGLGDVDIDDDCQQLAARISKEFA